METDVFHLWAELLQNYIETLPPAFFVTVLKEKIMQL